MSVFILPESNAKRALAQLHFTTRTRSMTGGADGLLLKFAKSGIASRFLHNTSRFLYETTMSRNQIIKELAS